MNWPATLFWIAFITVVMFILGAPSWAIFATILLALLVKED
jgi:hypothetical protein